MYYLGVDLGGTNIAVGLVDEQGNIIHKDSVPTKSGRSYQEIMKDMAMLCLKVIKDAGYSVEDVKSIGIGSPGTPDNKKGTLVYANNLDFYNVPMRDEMKKYIDLPIIIDNDANCAALAEAIAGAAKGKKHSVTITLGTGVGSGVVINGKIYNGFNYAACELGHMVIIVNGEQCTCGRKGCWEVYASATGLINQTRQAAIDNPKSYINEIVNGDLDKIDGKTAFDAMRAGDDVGKKVVSDYIRYISEGLVNVVNIFQPEVIVIGGGICKEGDNLIIPIKKYLSKYVYCKDIEQPELKVAVLGNDAGIIGAAMLGK